MSNMGTTKMSPSNAGNKTLRKTLLGIGLAMAFTLSANATVVTLHSGNGTVGGTDSLITFLDGPLATDFALLTPANFLSAQTGTAASIINRNPAWLASLPEDANAKWIGTNSSAQTLSAGDTGLYAMSFFLPFPVFSATLDLHYAVDNSLGGANNAGVFLNGTALSPTPGAGSYNVDTAYSNANIGSLLQPGVNWIYFDAVNLGGPAGLIFTATITTADNTAAPEPATFAMFGGALVLIGSLRRFRSARSKS